LRIILAQFFDLVSSTIVMKNHGWPSRNSLARVDPRSIYRSQDKLCNLEHLIRIILSIKEKHFLIGIIANIQGDGIKSKTSY